MALRFEQSFTVKAAAGTVWAYLTDPYRVVTALPGAEVTEKVDDFTYAGAIAVKVGPVSARYRGTARFERLDAPGWTAEVVARGQDVSGRGGADMRMSSRLVERAPGETEVSVATEVNVTGLLAQLGRGMIQDVSNQMFQRFTEAVRAELERPATATGTPEAAPSPAPPVDVVSLGGGAAARALARAARRPVFWLVVLLVVGLGWLLLR